MKAVMLVPGPGGAAIDICDVPMPTIGARDVLVRVKATALNRGEIAGRRRMKSGKPYICGIELAGEVADVGAAVTGFRVGDRVMGQIRRAIAEYAVADQDSLMPVPEHLDWTQAAALPNTLITCHDALVTNGRLQPGESVLINAGSSGIGIAAIQIARFLGAGTVIASSRSPEKLPALRQLGADATIDLSRKSLTDGVREATDGGGVNLIIDSVGGPDFPDNMAALAVKGRLVSVGRLGGDLSEINLDLIALKRLKIIGVTFRTRDAAETIACAQACARDLLPAVTSGAILPVVDRVYPVDEIDAAHCYMETDAHTGKIVLTL